MSIQKAISNFIVTNYLIEDECGDELQPQDSLLEKGIIDSTGILDLVSFIEQRYSFKVDDEELLPENFDSIDSITSFIARKTDSEQMVSDQCP